MRAGQWFFSSVVSTPYELQHVLVYEAIGRQYLMAVGAYGSVRKIGGRATGLPHDQHPGGRIPWLQSVLPVARKSSAGDEAQVQRG